MSTLYTLQNQNGYFLGSKGLNKGSGKSHSKNAADHEWVDGQDPGAVYRTAHKDEAINMQFEVNACDFSLRLKISTYEANAKNHPVIPDDELPPPLPKHTPDMIADAEAKECEDDAASSKETTDDASDGTNGTTEITATQTELSDQLKVV